MSKPPAAVEKAPYFAAHSRMPVGEGSPDNMVGVVQVREIVRDLLRGEPLNIRRHVRQAPLSPTPWTPRTAALLGLERQGDD